MTDLHRPGRSIVSGRLLAERAGNKAAWIPEAMRATLITMTGSLAQVTIHADERAEIARPAVLRDIWARAWRTARAEIAAAKNLTDEARAEATRVNDAIYSRAPLGVLCIRPWSGAR